MKRISSIFCLLCFSLWSYGQVVLDGPLANINGTVEGQEFAIFHTNSLGGSDSSTRATFGHYDIDATTVGQRIVEDESKWLDTVKTYDEKFLNVLTLDYDGDGFDEVVMAHQQRYRTAREVRLSFPTISESSLNLSANKQDAVGVFSWPNGTNAPDRDPTLKWDKADFNGDRKEEIVTMFRRFQGEFMLQIRSVDIASASPSIIVHEVQVGDFFPRNNSAYEAYDLSVGDFDGDGKDDIAVISIEEVLGQRGVVLRLYEVTPAPNFINWTITLKTTNIILAIPLTANWENMALTSGNYDLNLPNRDAMAMAIAYNDNVGGTPTMSRRLLMIEANGPVGDELSNVIIGGIYNAGDVQNGDRPAVSLTSGDLNNDQIEEFIAAFDAEFRVYSFTSPTLSPKAQGSAGSVPDNFYQLVDANSYIAIGDVDWDLQKDILIVTTDDDGNSGNPQHFLRTSVFGINNDLSTLTLKAEKELQTKAYSGSSDDYHFAATFGAIRGGRFNLMPPHRFEKQIFRPLVVNNSPPYHFDIIGNDTVDLFGCYANGTFATDCKMFKSTYSTENSTSTTLETTMTSDWGVSSTLSAAGNVGGLGLKASITASYGEQFSNGGSNTQTHKVDVSTTAVDDDAIFGRLQTYDMYEYPVFRNGVRVGNVLTMKQIGAPIFTWLTSKADGAFAMRTSHEPGNLLSYPSLADFDVLAGRQDAAIQNGFSSGTVGRLIDQSANGYNFTMTYGAFSTSTASETQNFGLEVNAGASYYGVGLEATGTYNASEMQTHSSDAEQAVAFSSEMQQVTMTRDAPYTIIPQVIWSKNGAMTLEYAVNIDSSVISTNFWEQNYSQPDLSLILPWKYDEAKGKDVGPASKDKARLCKSLFIETANIGDGDTMRLRAFIQNYSLVDYVGPVEFQFYLGNPQDGGQLLSDINGLTTLTVTDTFKARNRTYIEFDWKVPSGFDPSKKLYIVIDPNNQITEVHDNNNTGWVPLSSLSTDPNPIEDEIAPLNAKVYPNPAQDRAQVDLVLDRPGVLKVEMMDMNGRVIATLYDHMVPAGNFILPVSLNDLPQGMYLIKATHNAQAKVMRLIHIKP
ncbi:MAG: T9SS type A sorting domain-containing protein [Bacteroidota bacterium]